MRLAFGGEEAAAGMEACLLMRLEVA